jgi:hypothetical protein
LQPLTQDLIADSRKGLSLMESGALSGAHPDAADLREAREYVLAHPVADSYHLLFLLRRHSDTEAREIGEDARSAILCAALTHLTYLNDWGYLEPTQPYDGEAAVALLETGRAAVKPLTPLLDDSRSAPLYGSEDAAMSSIYKYRRCDFAYRYLSMILGLKPEFDKNPKVRDRAIRELKQKLR